MNFTWLADNSAALQGITAIATLFAICTSFGWFRRARNSSRSIVDLEDRVKQFRKDFAASEVRLDQIDPVRFLEKLDALQVQGEYEDCEKLAQEYFAEQNNAIAETALVVAEREIFDTQDKGEVALTEALRFISVGLSAVPDDSRLTALEIEIKARIEAHIAGEDYDLLPPENLDTENLIEMAEKLVKAGDYALARTLAKRAVAKAPANSGLMVPALNSLGRCLRFLGLYSEAERIFRSELEICKTVHGPKSAVYGNGLNSLGLVLRSMDRFDEAEPLLRQALELGEVTFGNTHPHYATSLSNLAELLGYTGRFEEAETLCRQALEIRKATVGETHPDFARDLSNLAVLLGYSGRRQEAEPLQKQALEIDRATFGATHPAVAHNLNNLAGLYYGMDRFAEAEPLMAEALSILEGALPADHPNIIASQETLTAIRAKLSDQP